ncbi:MAG: F0F1 ATP synthase subunit delta [Alphaproteobacteria bacterium]|nr:F0F1 ATP synthase subunit delta [Alphaproteobacteria bacterium]
MAAKGGVNEIADRYAKALFDLADEGNQLDVVANDLRTLSSLIDSSEDLQRMVRSPIVSRADQGKAITVVAEKAELSDLTRRFVQYAAAQRRLAAIKPIAKAYLTELAFRRGEVSAEVSSAKPLSKAQVKAVEEALKKAVGGKVAVSQKVDPSLIGGLIIKVGSRMIDTSVSSQLQRLKLAMKGA